MWESGQDSQGLWEGWKACFWLSMLSTDRHFHGLLLGRFCSFLLPVESPTKAIRFGSGLQNMCAVSDAVEKRLAQPGIRNDLRPLRKWQISGQHHRGSLRTFCNHLKQELGADF